MRGSQRYFPAILIGLGLLGLAAVTALGITAVHYARRAQSLVDHTQDVINQERLLLTLMLDAETGERGYLLTRRQLYLEPWTSAQAKVPASLQELARLIADNPEQQRALTRLDVLIGRKFEDISQELAEADRAGTVRDIDKVVMDGIRVLLTEFEKRELTFYDERKSDLRHRFDALQLVLLLAGMLSLAGLAFGAWGLQSGNRKVAEAEAVNRQARKMEAIGNLTGGIAHDFNNLLQVVITNLDFAIHQIGPKQPASGFLQSALLALEKGERLTGQLLAFARRQPLKPEPINVAALIEEVGTLLRRTLGESCQIECVAFAGLWRAMADASLLQNAIVNLALNARDAMPQGGKLTIEASNVTLDSDYAETAHEVTPGPYVMIAVSDTGTGMTKEELGRVFEPFYTTKESGTGLGLPMVYGFVKQSGGHISLYSEPGQGTTVKLYLPRTTREEIARDTSRRLALRGRGQRILVAEDDDSVRAGVVAQLTDLGYSVLAAGDADTALALVLDNAEIDLLFTDVVLGGRLNGRQLAEALHELQPSLPVIYTSGYTENAIVHHGRLDEGVTLLSKPYRADQLARAISDALQAKEAPPEEGREEAESILIVEDNKLVRRSLAMMLEDLGYRPIETETAKQALAAIDADASIAAAMVDLRLPDLDGVELAKALRRKRPDLRLVIASGQSVPEASLAEIPGPPVGTLMKPFNALQLEKLLFD
ncbi:MAG TPA: response regulator [Magnetospirillaceae bacterium]|nr:response regulator [Magnetospirillaceae bacterium]